MKLEKKYTIFEKVNHLIQESFRSDTSTEILCNYRIKNRRGKRREIDILIKSIVNSTPIQIAIECKDHKRVVGEPSIEAFKAKCESIPNIHKRIFVSAKGYSRGAIDAAFDYDIDLYKLEEMDIDTVKNWFILQSHNTYVSHREVKITKVCREKYAEFNGKVEKPFIVDYEHQKGIKLNEYLSKYIEENIPGKVILMTKKEFDFIDIEFVIKHPNALIVHNNKIDKLKHIHFIIKHTFTEVKNKVIVNRFQDESNNKEALNATTIISERGDYFSIIRNENSNKVELLTNSSEGFEKIDEIDIMNQEEGPIIKVTKSAIFIKEKMDVVTRKELLELKKADNK